MYCDIAVLIQCIRTTPTQCWRFNVIRTHNTLGSHAQYENTSYQQYDNININLTQHLKHF